MDFLILADKTPDERTLNEKAKLCCYVQWKEIPTIRILECCEIAIREHKGGGIVPTGKVLEVWKRLRAEEKRKEEQRKRDGEVLQKRKEDGGDVIQKNKGDTPSVNVPAYLADLFDGQDMNQIPDAKWKSEFFRRLQLHVKRVSSSVK